jgi:hypothetical protein
MPIRPPEETGIILPSCRDRSEVFVIPQRTGEGLRIGGDVIVCLACGPDGSVYHPVNSNTMDDLRRKAAILPSTVGYDPSDLTPAVMAEYDAKMRRLFGSKPKP